VKRLQNLMIYGSCKMAKYAVICVSSLFSTEMSNIFEYPFKVGVEHLFFMYKLNRVVA
jgi:hypothetical protein